ncbi:MAG: acyl-CoA dehydrogenase [Myxococcales bacterium]|nr:acyl-CoA dehydrogenase [Myxococcales bacterium]
MSNAPHYHSNLRDILFNLFEVLDVGNKALGHGPFTSMDTTTARDTLTTLDGVVKSELASSFVEADRVPLILDEHGNVTLPAGLQRTLEAWFKGEWHRLELPESLGGYGAPPSIYWSSFEMQAGANATAAFYFFGTLIAKVIDRLGTDGQKKRFVENLIERHWGGTMVLTEPDAGSDVGAGRAKAKHIEGEVWEIEGTKRFITNGDFGTENIVHLVLARPEGGAPGTKGLSMFLVPKFWVNEDGSMGERNGVFVTNIEKKMGIKGSATAELTLGDAIPCRGLLVGNVHDGIRQMFHVIEHARMAVGIKSMSTVSTAYLNALAYAKERVQGADLKRATDKDAPRVRIIEHPDVRRMLLELKAHAEGMRALVMFTSATQDQVEILGGHGNSDAAALDRRNDLLLPLVKGFCSHRGYYLLGEALQVFGGSGFVQDYPMEQYIRDQKIDSLYEGTTHIQAQDLVFRKVMRDGGATLRSLLGEAETTAKDLTGHAVLGTDAQALLKALGDLQGLFMALLQKGQESIYHIGLQANRLLFLLAEVVIGWRLLVAAQIADSKLGAAVGKDKDFYAGKLAVVRYWSQNVLPAATLTRKLVESSSLSPYMDLPEEAF